MHTGLLLTVEEDDYERMKPAVVLGFFRVFLFICLCLACN